MGPYSIGIYGSVDAPLLRKWAEDDNPKPNIVTLSAKLVSSSWSIRSVPNQSFRHATARNFAPG